MPLHEYLCHTCDGRFEAITSSAKADSVACPMCQSAETRRLISVIAGIGRGSSSGPAPKTPMGSPIGMGMGGGGCCGGSCGCGSR
jgi:putative FmdB family regulatory protein